MPGHAKKISRYRKRFGQVFLQDPMVVDTILQSLNLKPLESVLEIGPGRGALTHGLAQRGNPLYAIEIEAGYVAALQQRFAMLPHVHIIQADARRYDYRQLPAPLVVVANLPYSMGMPILRHLFAFRQRLSRLTIMLQQEVAARLLASPGTSAYSAVSVFFQYYAAIRHEIAVSRYAFSPVPSVDSTVLSLEPYTTLPWVACDEQFFLNMVKIAFMHRRKTLRSNLLNTSSHALTSIVLDALFASLGLATTIRPQDVAVSQFVQLAALLQGLAARRNPPCRAKLQESS